jgi:hypothetical protein
MLAQLPGCHLAASFRVAPGCADESVTMVGVGETATTNTATLRRDVEAVMPIIRATRVQYRGVILVTSGPAPLAYMLGMTFKSSLDGDLVLFEQVQRRYQLVERPSFLSE